ncbi:MAG TPA: hypothetical protein VGF15_01100 [Solirubrobacteraceae bacterium]
MNRSIRLSMSARLALCTVLALAALSGASAGAASVFHFQRESMQEFQSQLAKGEIHAATFNKVPHSLHLSMNDHRHLLVVYPPAEYKQLYTQLKAKGVSVAIEKHAKTAAKPAKHTLRYIAGGILVVVILVVLIVLLIGRRRDLLSDADESAQAGEEPSSSPAESG